MKESDYTPESWKALQDALAEAEALKETGIISQIQAAQKKVEDAAVALKKKDKEKPSTSSSPAPGTKPTNSPDEKPAVSPGVQPTNNASGVQAT